MKQGLRTTIVPRLISTATTGLAGVTWVNTLNPDTSFLCFVEGEARQLSKGPTVQTTLPFSFAMSDPFSDISQVLKDYRASWWDRVNNALGEDMIAIPVEKRLLSAQLLEVLLRRLGSFGLQPSLETETAAVNFFPVTLAKEASSACHGGSRETKVYAYHLTRRGNVWLGHINHHMQPPRALARDEVCCGDLVSSVLGTKTER